MALAVTFGLGLVLGLIIGTSAVSRSAQATTPPTVPSGSDDAQAPRMTLRPTVSAVSPTSSASPELSGTPHLAGVGQEIATAMEGGLASHMGNTQGPGYLALPGGPGQHVRICGPVGCVPHTEGQWIVSTDAGPDLAMQRQGRIVDLYIGDFLKICGSPSLGLCRVTVEYR